MKKFVTMFLVVAIAMLLAGCEDTPEQKARERERIKQFYQMNANEVVSKIQYIKDPRTGLCFAYYYERGAVLAIVPESSIPKELLWIGGKEAEKKAEKE